MGLFDNLNFDLSNFKKPSVNPEIFLDFRDPDEVTNNILNFLKEQSKNAEKQFNTSRNLIVATIAIMILQIVISAFSIALSNSEQNNLNKIIEMQSQQSEVISRMSLDLLDLQNQVQILEKENNKLSEILNE